MYYLLDLERTIQSGLTYYWKPGKRGYTIHLEEAGLYTKEAADDIVSSDYDKRTVMISEEVVNRLRN